MSIRFIVVALFLSLSFMSTSALAAEEQLVAGAGPSTKVVELFFSHFSKNPVCADYNFSIMPGSIKHKGGINSAKKFLFGRTGRPLNKAEKAKNVEEILLGKVPISFAIGLETGVKKITLQQLRQIFNRKVKNWSEIGGKDAAILLVGREPTEALFLTLKQQQPWFSKVSFDKTFKRDNDVMKFLRSPAGAHAIAFGAKPNFSEHNRLTVEGFSAGVPVGLVYDLKRKDHPVIKAAIDYAGSEEWHALLPSIDMLPIE